MRRSRNPIDYNRPASGGPAVPWDRPAPSPELDATERAIWTRIVSRLPVDWFTVECQPVLRELCRHIHYANDLASDMATMRAMMEEIRRDADGSMTVADRIKAFAAMSADLHNLMKIHMRQSTLIANLSTRLRLTPQSRYEALRANDESKTAKPPGAQPWDDWMQRDEDRPQDSVRQ